MAISIQEVATAIYSAATGDATFNTAMGGRIRFEEYRTADGSHPSTYPICVFHIVGENPTYNYTSDFSEIQIQFSIFDDSENGLDMMGYLDALYNVFDNATFTLTTWNYVSMFRDGTIPNVPDDHNVRHAAVTYTVRTHKVAA